MKLSRLGLIASLWLLAAVQASAGMTGITLTDIARTRIDALSFFLSAYLVTSGLVKLLWNYLASTSTVLPRLDYRRALGLVFLTGLMFYVVLTMISGARELLTPGAWEKQGTGYRIREDATTPLTKEERRKSLRRIQEAIWSDAKGHESQPPVSPMTKDIDRVLWSFAGGGLYCLMPGVLPGGGRDVRVYEPSAAGGRRFVLLADGTIEDHSERAQLEEQSFHRCSLREDESPWGYPLWSLKHGLSWNLIKS